MPLTGTALEVFNLARDYMIDNNYTIVFNILEYTCRYRVDIINGVAPSLILIFRELTDIIGIQQAGVVIHLLRCLANNTKIVMFRYNTYLEAIVYAFFNI